MAVPPRSDIAVLTGDLVESTQAEAGATETAMQDLAMAADEVADWTGADSRFTRFRGDGWQIVLSRHPDLALRASIFLFARLKGRKTGLRTRIAVAIGPGEDLGSADLADARGEAFSRSGRTLDAMQDHALRLDFAGIHPVQRGFIDLLEPMLWRWTPEQAEAVSHSLHPGARSQKDIARRLGISEQAVSLRLRGAHDFALRQALAGWEAEVRMPEPDHA